MSEGNITVGDISGASGVAIGDGASAAGGNMHTGDNIHTGDKIDISGDLRGANVNIKSTLTNVNQSVGSLSQADDADKKELKLLLDQLEVALQQVPPDKAQEAKNVAKMTGMLVDAAGEEEPNTSMMQISGEGLKKAAENLANIVPDVVKIAGSIVRLIIGLG